MSSITPRHFQNRYPDYQPDLVSLEQMINKSFWKEYIRTTSMECMMHLKPKSSSKYCNGKIYTGNLGLVFMSYKLLTSRLLPELDNQFKQYIQDCIYANEEYYINHPNQHNTKDVSFILGKGGELVMGCFASKILGQENNLQKYVHNYSSLAFICEPIDFLRNGSDELFVGRAGYLCGLLVLKKYLNIEPLPKSEIFKICDSIIQSGRNYSNKVSSPSPLMYAYHGTEYLGAAHGLAGILLMLLSFPGYLRENPESDKYVKQSVDFLLSIQKSNGNFPSAMDELNHSMPRQDNKDLVHWCHGAGGIIFLLAKSYLHWRDPKYLNACIKCGDLIWQSGLLRKGPGICHGIGGNGYAHLLLYRLTLDPKYLYRANKFAEFLTTDEFKIGARTPDSPYSLFEGLGGTVCFLIDLIDPSNAEYPLFPIF